jgi:hypothetical protein
MLHLRMSATTSVDVGAGASFFFSSFPSPAAAVGKTTVAASPFAARAGSRSADDAALGFFSVTTLSPSGFVPAPLASEPDTPETRVRHRQRLTTTM